MRIRSHIVRGDRYYYQIVPRKDEIRTAKYETLEDAVCILLLSVPKVPVLLGTYVGN